MKDDLVGVFEAQTLMEAKLVSDQLEAVGIESFIEHAESPLDGLVAADQVKIVRVLPSVVDRARQVVAEFEGDRSS